MNQMLMYQIFHQLTNIDSSVLFSFSSASSTRGHNYILNTNLLPVLKLAHIFWSTNNQVLEQPTVLYDYNCTLVFINLGDEH